MLMGAASTFETLDALSRTRPLSPSEVLQLERAVRRKAGLVGLKRWTKRDLARLKRYLERGKKPAKIAPLLGRTERAVWLRIYQEGWTVGELCPADVFTPSRRRNRSIAKRSRG